MSGIRVLGRPSERHALKVRLRRARLHTVCEEGRCPNIGDCFARQTAAFLVLGAVCTRSCRFCAVLKDRPPAAPDRDEPRRVAEAVRDLDVRHAVITSVTRDDLADGGAAHIAACIRAVRALTGAARSRCWFRIFKATGKRCDRSWPRRPRSSTTMSSAYRGCIQQFVHRPTSIVR